MGAGHPPPRHSLAPGTPLSPASLHAPGPPTPPHTPGPCITLPPRSHHDVVKHVHCLGRGLQQRDDLGGLQVEGAEGGKERWGQAVVGGAGHHRRSSTSQSCHGEALTARASYMQSAHLPLGTRRRNIQQAVSQPASQPGAEQRRGIPPAPPPTLPACLHVACDALEGEHNVVGGGGVQAGGDLVSKQHLLGAGQHLTSRHTLLLTANCEEGFGQAWQSIRGCTGGGGEAGQGKVPRRCAGGADEADAHPSPPAAPFPTWHPRQPATRPREHTPHPPLMPRTM